MTPEDAVRKKAITLEGFTPIHMLLAIDDLRFTEPWLAEWLDFPPILEGLAKGEFTPHQLRQICKRMNAYEERTEERRGSHGN